ncbi:hypothetical protein M1432_00465 [Patescibacteria group bacterium]|nr:hypothetical protein [Patescibacteria group bacterium]
MEKTEMDIHPKIPAGTEWYVHPRSDAVNAEMAVRSNGGDVVCLDTEEGQKDVPVWKTGFDRIQGFINFIQGGRRDIKLDVYRKEPGERLLRFVMRLN